MKAKVICKHDGEGLFPTFAKGTKVIITGSECTHFLHWFPCEIEGHLTYIPKAFLNDDLTLARDYNPTELVLDEGSIIEIKEIVNAWLIATTQDGQTGWIPAESVISI